MDFLKDAKEGTCPNCGGPKLKPVKIVGENNVAISGKLCEDCSWNG